MIIASITSWKGRINTLGFTLFCFLAKQTLRPNKIVLTLSSEEFPNGQQDLPTDLQRVIVAFNIKVLWSANNIFSHKKYEVFRYYPNEYCVILDDDILYPSDYIYNLYHTSLKFPHTVICYRSQTVDYNRGQLIKLPFNPNPNHKNLLYSGLSMFPPNTFPQESFHYTNIRDKVVPRCDDSWVKAWLIKSGTKISAINEFTPHCIIDIPNTQEQSIWSLYNSKRNANGITTKYINMINVCNALQIHHIAMQIWPNLFNI